MPEKIVFRPGKIVAIDALPADGFADPWADEFAALATESAAIEEDDARDAVVPPFQNLLQLTAKARRMHWMLVDDADRRVRSPSTSRLILHAQDLAAKVLPTSGWGGPQDLILAQATARANEFRAAQKEMADVAVSRMQPKIDPLTEALAKAPQDVIDALEGAAADFDAPSALRNDVEIVDLQKRLDVETEIAAWKDPMQRAAQELERMIKFNKVDLLKNYVPAARRAAVETLKIPAPKIAALREARHDGRLEAWAADEHVKARQLIDLIDAYIASQRPPSIALVNQLLLRLRPMYQTIVGIATEHVPFAVRSRVYFVDGAHKGADWEIDPTWPTRFIPPSQWTLPGWSRMLGKTQGGVPIREPRPLTAEEVVVS
jgi:hypothetical protein